MIFMVTLSLSSNSVSRFARRACVVAFGMAAFATGEACAQSAVTGVPNAMQGFSQNRGQPIKIEAATLEMRDKKKEATFSGSVKVVQGDTTMTSKTLVVFYESAPPSAAAPAANANAAAKSAPMQSALPGPGGSSSIRRLEARGNVVMDLDNLSSGDASSPATTAPPAPEPVAARPGKTRPLSSKPANPK